MPHSLSIYEFTCCACSTSIGRLTNNLPAGD